MKLAILLLAVSAWAQVPIGSSGGSSSGGGATSLSSITDFRVTYTDATHMAINSAAAVGARVNGGVGLTSYAFTSAGEVTSSGSGTGGTVWWSQASDGAIYATPSTLIVGCVLASTGSTAVTIDTAGTTFKGKQIATTTLSNACEWSSAITDNRAFFSQGRIITGSGCIAATTTATSTDLDGSACGSTPPVINTTGTGYIWAGPWPVTITESIAVGNGTMMYMQFVPTGAINVKTARFYNTTAGTGQYGSLCAYDSAGAIMAQAANVNLNASAGGSQDFTFASAVSLVANTTYYLGFAASTTPAWKFWMTNSSGIAEQMLNGEATKRYFTNTQTVSSPGASQTCPATITGTRTALTTVYWPMLLLVP